MSFILPINVVDPFYDIDCPVEPSSWWDDAVRSPDLDSLRLLADGICGLNHAARSVVDAASSPAEQRYGKATWDSTEWPGSSDGISADDAFIDRPRVTAQLIRTGHDDPSRSFLPCDLSGSAEHFIEPLEAAAASPLVPALTCNPTPQVDEPPAKQSPE